MDTRSSVYAVSPVKLHQFQLWLRDLETSFSSFWQSNSCLSKTNETLKRLVKISHDILYVCQLLSDWAVSCKFEIQLWHFNVSLKLLNSWIAIDYWLFLLWFFENYSISLPVISDIHQYNIITISEYIMIYIIVSLENQLRNLFNGQNNWTGWQMQSSK